MRPEDELLAALKKLDAPEPPPEIERAVMASFDLRVRRPRWRIWLVPAVAVMASATAVVAVLHLPQAPQPAPDQPFIEIPYTAPLAPYEHTEVRRLDVPIAALIAAGFEVHASGAASTLRADVLFGQDGRAYAIRLVNDSERRMN